MFLLWKVLLVVSWKTVQVQVPQPARRKVWRADVREDKFSKALSGGPQKTSQSGIRCERGDLEGGANGTVQTLWQRGCDGATALQKGWKPREAAGWPQWARGARRAASSSTESWRTGFSTDRVRKHRGRDKQIQQRWALSVLWLFHFTSTSQLSQ